MAKTSIADIQIKKAKAQEKDYFLNDSGRLRILIKVNSNKIWKSLHYK